MRGILVLWLALYVHSAAAQRRAAPGKPIGAVSTRGDLIVVTLDEGALGRANLFNLGGRTVRFTPEGAGYRVQTGALQWDAEFGAEMNGAELALRNFAFPFSGRNWNSVSVGSTGALRFGPQQQGGHGAVAPADGGIAIGRFDPLETAARALAGTVPAICVFFKPRMRGVRYAKELEDRVVITWSVTEPFGNIQDFGWYPTVNHFQAVLRRDGAIEMSYQEIAAKDAIVGVYATGDAAAGAPAPEVHLADLTAKDGPFPVVYEAFHYLALPNPRDLSCTVIRALGDKFDFLAYYSDFRVDNQEAGTPSNGPLGGNVTGIGQTQRGIESYCSEGRFQWGFVQPVYAGSNQMQEGPPADVEDSNPRNIATYRRQLGERSADGSMLPYNYAMSQIGHEMGHRWSAFVSAKVNGEVIPLGPTHWARGLHAPAAFPYQRPTEASAMGGGVWQDNFDGTFTQLDDDYYVPATGWSHLDLYLMGLISAAEVPDFFLLRKLTPAGRDGNGRPMFRADRVKVTIQDVIAAEGPRVPDVQHSQRRFNTGIVVMVEHGKTPSRELLERANAVRERWIDYWSVTTGGRSSMTASLK